MSFQKSKSYILQKLCFPSFSDFLAMIFLFSTLENIPGCIYSQKGYFLQI